MTFKFYRDEFHTAAYNEMLSAFESEINDDTARIDHAREINTKFFEEVGKIAENPNNAGTCGPLILDLLKKTPRYGYINMRHKEKTYEVQVDYLSYMLDIAE